jgi:uncharacterized protein (TIGR03083 family)
MKIVPSYDGQPLVQLEGEPSHVAEPLLRQRRRFLALITALTSDEWSRDSRSDGWRVQDVVAHLTSVDQFWNFSIRAGLAGSPSRMLAEFDPKATPAEIVDRARSQSAEQCCNTYADACAQLLTTIEGIGPADWTAMAEAPAGHVPISVLCHHALWDCWVHERDVLVPLGRDQEIECDEVTAATRFAAALSPAYALQADRLRTGALRFDLVDPEMQFAVVAHGGRVRVADGHVEADAPIVRGHTVAVLEALSVRAPWRGPLPEDLMWMVSSLGEIFESSFAQRGS